LPIFFHPNDYQAVKKMTADYGWYFNAPALSLPALLLQLVTIGFSFAILVAPGLLLEWRWPLLDLFFMKRTFKVRVSFSALVVYLPLIGLLFRKGSIRYIYL